MRLPLHRRQLVLIALLAAVLAACAPAELGEIIPTRTPLPPPTDTPPPPTVTPTTTPIPTLTPTPRPQATATPESALTRRGPWLVFNAIRQADPARPHGLFAVNADGSALTQLVEDDVVGFAGQDAASPASARLAYVAATREAGAIRELALKIVRVPDGQAYEAASLLPPGYQPPGPAEADDEARLALQAVEMQTPRWASDGDHVAFVALREGPTADVYLHNLFTRSTVRLSTEPGHAVDPVWSPDGRFIVYGVRHAEVEQVAAATADELRVAWTNGSGDRQIYEPTRDGERFFGWLAYNVVLVASYARDCGYTQLRAIDVDSTVERVLWPGFFRQAAFAPASGRVLLEGGALNPACEAEDAPAGLHVIGAEGPPQAVVFEDAPGPVQSIRWAETQGAFTVTLGEFGQPPSGIARVTPAGESAPLERPPGLRALNSPDGQLMAWYGDGSAGQSGLWVGPRDGLPEPIYDQSVSWVTWSPDSRALFFMRPAGSSDRLAYVALRPAFAPVPLTEGLEVRAAAWVYRPR